MEIPYFFLFFMEIYIKAVKQSNSQKTDHGFQKPHHLANLIKGHARRQKQNPGKKAQNLPSGKSPSQIIQKPCQNAVKDDINRPHPFDSCPRKGKFQPGNQVIKASKIPPSNRKNIPEKRSFAKACP